MCGGAGGSLQSAVAASSRGMAAIGAATGNAAVFWACRAPGRASGRRGQNVPARRGKGASGRNMRRRWRGGGAGCPADICTAAGAPCEGGVDGVPARQTGRSMLRLKHMTIYIYGETSARIFIYRGQYLADLVDGLVRSLNRPKRAGCRVTSRPCCQGRRSGTRRHSLRCQRRRPPPAPRAAQWAIILRRA